MGDGVTIVGNLHVTGRLTCGEALLPTSSVVPNNIAAGGTDVIDATKVSTRQRATYAQSIGSASVDDTKTIYVANGAGTVVKFSAGVIVVCSGAATITFDLKKNGTTCLTGVITIDNTHTARQVVNGTLSGGAIAFSAGDVFEVIVDATAGGGTVGQGAFARLVVDENPT